MRELVSISPCKHPRYTHRVRFPGPGGKRLGKFFTNETDALLFAKKQKQETGETGTSFGSLREEERSALAFWRSFVDEATPNAPDLLQVLRDYRTNWLASTASVTVKDAIDRFIIHQAAEGSGDRHLATLKSRLGRFETKFETALVSSITTTAFSEWLDGLKAIRADKEGAKLTLMTRHNLCRSIRSFFAFAVERGWTLQNPVPAQKRSKSKSARLAKKKAPEVMPPDQIQRFLSKVENLSASLVPFWALKFFAGIRDAEAARMTWEMILIKRKEIHLPAAITKTGEQRTVKIEPNLVKWLTPYLQTSGPVSPGPMTRRYWFKRIIAALSKENEASKEKAFSFPSNARSSIDGQIEAAVLNLDCDFVLSPCKRKADSFLSRKQRSSGKFAELGRKLCLIHRRIFSNGLLRGFPFHQKADSTGTFRTDLFQNRKVIAVADTKGTSGQPPHILFRQKPCEEWTSFSLFEPLSLEWK